jgi:hypothetical protein
MAQWTCDICEQLVDAIPEEAVQVTRGRGESRAQTYRFADGSFHHLRKLRTKEKQQPQAPAVEPKEDTELLQEVINTLAALPTPATPEPEPPKPEPQPLPMVAPNIEDQENLTAMEFAFRRIQGKL